MGAGGGGGGGEGGGRPKVAYAGKVAYVMRSKLLVAFRKEGHADELLAVTDDDEWRWGVHLDAPPPTLEEFSHEPAADLDADKKIILSRGTKKLRVFISGNTLFSLFPRGTLFIRRRDISALIISKIEHIGETADRWARAIGDRFHDSRSHELVTT